MPEWLAFLVPFFSIQVSEWSNTTPSAPLNWACYCICRAWLWEFTVFLGRVCKCPVFSVCLQQWSVIFGMKLWFTPILSDRLLPGCVVQGISPKWVIATSHDFPPSKRVGRLVAYSFCITSLSSCYREWSSLTVLNPEPTWPHHLVSYH